MADSVAGSGTEVHEKWGFGMAPVKAASQQERLIAAKDLLLALENSEVTPSLDNLSIIKGLFNRTARQDQWDWFTILGQLGYPSARISTVIASELAVLRTALKDENRLGRSDARSALRRLPTRRCLSVFLGHVEITQEAGAGWIYLLSTRETPDLVKVGVTTRTVEERVREINSATGVPIPYGVRGCWRVDEPKRAERLVHEAMAELRIRGDREFFRSTFSEAKKRIAATLKSSNLELRTLDNLSSLVG